MQKNARLEARLTPDVHNLLKRAADIQGRSLSDFVISAARRTATKTIEQADIIRLSQDEQQRFVAALLDPPPLSLAMKRAIQRHKELVGSLV